MSRMPIINFDEHFADYTSAWMKEHGGDYASYDEMEEDLPRIYMKFLNTRASWLGSLTPPTLKTVDRALRASMDIACESGET